MHSRTSCKVRTIPLSSLTQDTTTRQVTAIPVNFQALRRPKAELAKDGSSPVDRNVPDSDDEYCEVASNLRRTMQ
jgi:hypothetical protein